MLKKQFTWETKNVLDNVPYDEKDHEQFRKLMHVADNQEEEPIISTGAILQGTIVEITKDHVVIDVGLKSEGLIPISEFIDPSELQLHRSIEVFLDRREDERGQIVLSREKAIKQRQWEYICNHCHEGSIVKGKILRKVKGGLMVDIGMEAFLPGSQIDNKRIKDIDEFLGQQCEFKILKINIERKNVVVSRRELLEAERVSKKAKLLETIQEGDVKRGLVKNITDFGVFFDLDGIDGLLHITDMTWKRIKHPSEIVTLGQELDVMILSIDHDKGRVALGLKQREMNPWDEIEQKYPIGKLVHGKIVKILPYGAFIELEPGIEGLIHVSEMSWTKNVTDPTEVVNKGDEVDAIVLSLQKEEGKISLGIKQTQNNPWDYAATHYTIGSNVSGKIKSLTNYGAFVQLEPGIEGLIHISDLSWIKKVSHPSEIFKKGDDVEAVVLSIDPESKKITLGVKQLSNNPWINLEKTYPIGSTVIGKVSKIAAFGAFIELEGGIEGLIHVTELSNRAFNKVEDIVTVGDKVTTKVIKVDPEHKKIALSLKACALEQGEYGQDDIILSHTDHSNADPKRKQKRTKK